MSDHGPCEQPTLARPHMDTAAVFRLWDHLGAPVPDVARVGDQWLVTHRRLVTRILTDTGTFSPANALDAVSPMSSSTLRALAGYRLRLPPTLANNHTPTHPGLRALVGDALRPARVEALRPWLDELVRRRVAHLAARLRGGEQVDLHAELTADIPLLALDRLIGLPIRGGVKEMSAAALELFWAPAGPQRQLELAHIVGGHHAQLRQAARNAGGLAADLRRHAEANGLAEDDVVAALFFLLVAGQETTAHFLGLQLHRLITERDALDALTIGTASVADVVEEGLRLNSSIVTWRRTALHDATIGDVPIPRGAPILLSLAHAGRDGLANPDAFIPGRAGSRRHLSFGAGAHRCLGAQLARLEAQVVVEHAAPLLRNVDIVAAPSHPDNLSFRLLDRLIVATSHAHR